MARRQLQGRRRSDSRNIIDHPYFLPGAGAVAIAYAAYQSRNKARPGYTPDFFGKPAEDWSMMPAVQRQVLLNKYGGAIGYRDNVHPLPIMYLADMAAIDVYWRGVAQRADVNRGTVYATTPYGTPTTDRALPSILDAHVKRMKQVKMKVFGDRNRFDLVGYLVSGDVDWLTLGSLPATRDEIAAFWDAIDRTAIAVAARLAWDPNEYLSLASVLKEQGAAISKAVNEAIDKSVAWSFKAFLYKPLLWLGSGLIFWHVVKPRSY